PICAADAESGPTPIARQNVPWPSRGCHRLLIVWRNTECKRVVASKVVLVVDEDGDIRAEIRECLANRQIACREAGTAREALRAALEDPPDLILVDLVLPDQSGLGLCRTV